MTKEKSKNKIAIYSIDFHNKAKSYAQINLLPFVGDHFLIIMELSLFGEESKTLIRCELKQKSLNFLLLLILA